GRRRRRLRWPVHLEVAGRLVDLVLDDVEGRQLDVSGDDGRRLGPGLEPVPRMRPPFGELHRADSATQGAWSRGGACDTLDVRSGIRSEEHTSELQSRENLV